MSVSTFTQPDYTAQTGAAYKANLDGAADVFKRLAGAFAPHAQSTPAMTVRLDAGAIFDGTTLTEVAAQSTGTITAPSTNPRIDRVVVDKATGAVSVITGTEDASPSAPAITAGKAPVAQVSLVVSQSSIVNADITDERQLGLLGLGDLAALGVGEGLESSGGNLRVNALHERRTADYTALAADRGKLIEMDKATAVTLNLTAAATLGEGWFVYVNNSGAGVLTIDGSGAEKIDDATTITLDQNESAIVFCDGAAFWTVGKSAGGPAQATQAAIENETDEDTYAPPDLIKHIPGVTKLWGYIDRSAGTPSLQSPSYNISSVTDGGAGNTTINAATDFSSAIYSIGGTAVSNKRFVSPGSIVAGSFEMRVRDNAGAADDTADFTCLALGDQA